jgi:plasmid stabilization system protein ParE
MSLPVVLRAEAEEDIQAAREHFERIRPGLSSQFVAGLRELLEGVELTPELYGLVRKDIRAARLRFRYVAYYVAFSDRVEVLAILHGARDPTVWESRRGAS